MAVLVVTSGLAQAGPLIDTLTSIPDDLVLGNFRGRGLDWVYPGPTRPIKVSTGAAPVEPPSYRAGEGWRYATEDEWAFSPSWSNFIKPGFTAADIPLMDNYLDDHTKYRFAVEYRAPTPM